MSNRAEQRQDIAPDSDLQSILSPDLAPDVTQRKASNPETSVWVNASAGSGKTSVLTSRVLRLLLAGVKPQKILCLTYTRAAAAEMSIRVMDRLSKWAIVDDDQLGDDLGKLQGYAAAKEQMTAARRLFAQVLACPGGMRIRTIHAFCQEILHRFPIEAGLPPHFAVIEEGEAADLIDDTLRDLLREAKAKPDSALAQSLTYLIDELDSRSLGDALRRSLYDRTRILAASRQAGGVKAASKRLRDLLGLRPDDTAASLIEQAVKRTPETEIRAAAALLLTDSKSFAKLGEIMLQWLALPFAGRVENVAAYKKAFLTKENEPLARPASKKLLEKNPGLETTLRDEAQRLQQLHERLNLLNIAETTQAYLTCANFMIAGYALRKRHRAALDYDDLINRTTALFQREAIAPWVMYKLDEGLDHLLVDEAQDTSQAQWDIVAALVEEFYAGRGARDGMSRTLFVVGDEKQSIFSFQHADPEAFLARRSYFRERILAAERKYQEVPLQVSFRSAPAILRAVDRVFAPEAARDGVSIEPVRHLAFHAHKLGQVEIWPLQPAREKAPDDTDHAIADKYEDDIDPQTELAEKIAATIAGWLARRERLPGEDRPIAPGDIMILLRSRGDFAKLMVRALKKAGVPVTGVDRMRLVKQLPVMDLLALLRFALLPGDDLNLATVLRGPLIGLDEDGLMRLAIGRDGASLWQRLRDAVEPVFQTIVTYLDQWLAEADFITPFAMLADILNRPCPADSRSGRRALWARLGLDALDPIDELLNAAQNFTRRQTPSLQGFLHWLMASDSEIKRELDQGAGQVRIMTVHASKGLEAPIVFLPDTVATPDSGKAERLLWHGQGDGLTPLYVARKTTAGLPGQIAQAARHKQMQEYRRLLYVALTRASNRLYIAGWDSGRSAADNPDNWYNLVRSALAADSDVTDDGAIVMRDVELTPPEKSAGKNAQPAKPANVIDASQLPVWALTAPSDESAPTPVLVPSRLTPIAPPVTPTEIATPEKEVIDPPATATPDNAFTRGRIIHRLLQSLPDLAPETRATAARRFLANPAYALDPKTQTDIAAEVIRLLDDPAFAPLFARHSRAEVPLVGRIGGHIVSGQVDRLCVQGDEVWIVDYKTNRPPPTDLSRVPDSYRRQLALYRLVLAAIYPGKTVRCFLLWTYAPYLMELPAQMLDLPASP